MASILEICQDAAALAATQKPQNLFDSSSLHEAIFLSIAKSTLESLRRYGDWQELIKEGVLKTHENKKIHLSSCYSPYLPDIHGISRITHTKTRRLFILFFRSRHILACYYHASFHAKTERTSF